VRVHVGASQEPELFELVDAQQVGLVKDQDHGAAAFVFLGGEHLGGLWDQCGLVETRDPTQGGDDPGVEAAATDGGVALVDGGVPGWV
jgi:hypothetical protein